MQLAETYSKQYPADESRLLVRDRSWRVLCPATANGKTYWDPDKEGWLRTSEWCTQWWKLGDQERVYSGKKFQEQRIHEVLTCSVIGWIWEEDNVGGLRKCVVNPKLHRLWMLLLWVFLFSLEKVSNIMVNFCQGRVGSWTMSNHHIHNPTTTKSVINKRYATHHFLNYIFLQI